MDILKLRWPLTIIIAGELILIIVFTLYSLDLIELKTLITLVFVEIFAGIIGYLLVKQNETMVIKREEKSKQKEKLEQERDKERIYNWLYNETRAHKEFTVGRLNDPRWRSTKDISSFNNLNINLIRDICCNNEKIILMGNKDIWLDERLEEKWAIKEFVR